MVLASVSADFWPFHSASFERSRGCLTYIFVQEDLHFSNGVLEFLFMLSFQLGYGKRRHFAAGTPSRNICTSILETEVITLCGFPQPHAMLWRSAPIMLRKNQHAILRTTGSKLHHHRVFPKPGMNAHDKRKELALVPSRKPSDNLLII